ncbi:MAG: 2-amino-4-hydroxy-6-hydroxymethyldihydropteridine diphosphokinase [Lachnospiraceae bacterium]|nr:2-amino-4-hydroxy-6-hydroxymethyldihydropteridine diphosphokinase [Lachnospiraceae bacterium]
MDRIEIKGLKVFAYHGVLEKEKEEGQDFFVDATMYLDIKTPGRSDDLDDTVNYASVCELIDRFLKENRYDLIETAARQTAMEVLRKMPKIREIELSVHKPNAPIGLPFEDVTVTVREKWNTAYLSIGSNMGEKEEYLNQAVDALYDDENCRVIQVSNYIQTKPYGPVEQEDFLNGCLLIETLYTPHELLKCVNDIEADAHRERKIHWGPRTLDIDIVLYNEEIVFDTDLIIPHKEMHKRAFVLVPLAQIAPYAINPVLGKSVQVLLDELDDSKTESTVANKCGECTDCSECEGCKGCKGCLSENN